MRSSWAVGPNRASGTPVVDVAPVATDVLGGSMGGGMMKVLAGGTLHIADPTHSTPRLISGFSCGNSAAPGRKIKPGFMPRS
jgi:hypothetical protein